MPALLILAGVLLAIGLIDLSSSATATFQPSQNPAEISEKRPRAAFVPGDVLVRFKKDFAFEGTRQLAVPNNDSTETGKGFAALIASNEQVLVNVERFAGSEIVDGLRIARTAPSDTLKAIAALNARDDVLYAEPNYLRYPDATPNDPRFNELYGLNKIAAPQAWDAGTGSKNVVVAVIDEGIDINHEDLQANIWTNPSPGSIPGITGDLHGYDFRDNTGTLTPEIHATHVAGIIGAVGNNSVGVVGVNWNVSLMSLRFISAATNNGNDADALKAYNYVKQMRDLWVSSNGARGANIRVVNASYGGGGFSQAAYDAINALGQSGILFAAAAGNEGQNNDSSPHYPSNFILPNVISVAATNTSDQLASFSNRGEQTVWLGAPGSGILSTTPGNAYASLSGTSMATPHVAGAAALLYSLNPNLTPNRLRALLAFNGDMSSTFTPGLTISGRRLNVFNSHQAMNEGDTTAPGTVTNFRSASAAPSAIQLFWTASGDDGLAGQASLYQISFIDKFTGAETFLANVKPVASGAGDNITVPLPYRHTKGAIRLREFDNVGNEGVPVDIPITLEAMTYDPYEFFTSAAAPLSTGGTPLGLTFDDRYLKYDLPFSFSFFTEHGMFPFTSVTVSTNGNLYFFANADRPPPKRTNGDADDVPRSSFQLSQYQMVSGMWDDLDLRTSRRSDADVYVVPPDAGNPNRIIFRWQGVQFGDGTNGDPVNFEIELNRDGSIITRYGAGNTNLFPVVGIGGGKPDAYVVNSHTSETSPKTLMNAPSVTFIRRTRPVILLSDSNYNVSEGAGHATITLNRSGDLSAESTISYSTSDLTGATNCGANSGFALSRCDYITRFGTIVFAPNEATKTIDIPVIDDRYREDNEVFRLTLSNATDALVGFFDANITILDNDAANGPNPLSLTGFFVRQQYLDFLSREPDTSGFNFWVNNIDTCGADVGCREVRRIDTSAAFFLSIEFKETGYLVERIYKAAFGDATATSSTGGVHNVTVPIIRLNEFLPDTQRIGEGVIVNQGNWQQQLEDNKRAFTEEFVRRTTFVNAFPYSLTATQFVDKLNENAKDKNGTKPLSTVERDQLINDLAAGTMSRAQVLRAVAEDPDLVNSEISRAFVLMEYFGYLRRNPNDAPEATLDYAGFEFWLNKLDQFNGNYINAEMVKAFITSIEYGQRFGQ